jgi:hypothetical protein
VLRRPGEPPVRMWLRCGYYVVTSGSRRPGEPPVPCRLDTSVRSPCRSPAVRFVDGVRGGDGGGICGVHRSCGRGACSVLGAGSCARDGATALGAGSSARDGATALGAGSSARDGATALGAGSSWPCLSGGREREATPKTSPSGSPRLSTALSTAPPRGPSVRFEDVDA